MFPDSDRRMMYLRGLAERKLEAPSGYGGDCCFAAIPALELEKHGEAAAFPWEWVAYSLALLEKRKDCQDFAMAGLIRMLYRYGESELLTGERRQAVLDAFLQAKYAELDPTEDCCCWHTENHQVLYGSAEYLIGQLLPESVFATTGKLGCWHRERARERLYRWLDWRLRFDFSEWNSSCYYDEDAAALLNLVEHAADARLRHKAIAVLNLLLFHVAANSWQGITAFSQGRAYEQQAKQPGRTAMATLAALVWGDEPAVRSSFACILLAAGTHTIPPVLAAIGRDDAPAIVRERHSLHPQLGLEHGVDPDRHSSLDFWRGAGLGSHPAVVEAEYVWRNGQGKWDNYFYARDYYRKCREAGQSFDADGQPHAMSTANLYTCRTRDYVLSSAQEYRPGLPGYQQFIWCAALGPEAVVFTTNPAPPDVPYGRPGPWVGNGILPRVLQHHQVLLAIHCVRPYPIYDQPPWFRDDRVHAWVPRAQVDECVERGVWLFLRRGDGYLALGATAPATWRGENEWNVDATDVVFCCEMGSRAEHGSFHDFVTAIADAPFEGGVDGVRYVSPSLGLIEAGWEQPLRVNGVIMETSAYPRFDTPWCQAAFGSTSFEIRHGQDSLKITPEP